MPFVSAIVLAAGESTRMGRQKALMDFEGTTLIEYQVTQLLGSGEVAEIVVVTGHHAEAIVANLGALQYPHVAHNPNYVTGKISSIKTGLGVVSPEADSILIIAVDQPRPASIIRELVHRHLESRSLITIPTAGGRRGHPIALRCELLIELMSMTEKEQGLRGVIDRHHPNIQEVEFNDARVLVDLNAPGDVDAAMSLDW